MSEADEIVQAFSAVKDRFIAARKAVTDWMDAEGAEGRFRQNHQAPGWGEYIAAEEAYVKASAAMDILKNSLPEPPNA